MGRGYQVCRFIAGAPLAGMKIKIMVPFGPGSMASNIRMRYGSKVYMAQVDAPYATIKYTDLFSGTEFTKDDDGPIQILVKTLNKDGSYYESLGYLFVIVLSRGYSIEPSKRVNKCTVEYSDMGESKVECDN